MPMTAAIHTGTLDCFTLRVRNDGSAGRLHESPLPLSALLKCIVFFPMTTQDLHSCKTFRLCERNDGAAGRLHKSSFPLFALLKTA
jgi:hypothetical protein